MEALRAIYTDGILAYVPWPNVWLKAGLPRGREQVQPAVQINSVHDWPVHLWASCWIAQTESRPLLESFERICALVVGDNFLASESHV